MESFTFFSLFILSIKGIVLLFKLFLISSIVIKGTPQARLKPKCHHSQLQRLAPGEAPRLEHFQVFFSFFFFFFFYIFSTVGLCKEPLGFFFFCNKCFFFFLNIPKQCRFELYLEFKKKASSAPKRRRFGPICMIFEISAIVAQILPCFNSKRSPNPHDYCIIPKEEEKKQKYIFWCTRNRKQPL